MNTYPQTLINALAQYKKSPTGNIDWDEAVLAACKSKEQSARTWLSLHEVAIKMRKDIEKKQLSSYDLQNKNVYKAHANLLLRIANEIVLERQRRQFIIDNNNRDIIRFLLYYFNGCPLAEKVFPGRGYKLHKNIMLQGGVGVGKTMLMLIFSEYLMRIRSPRFFYNLSVTQMVNYYTLHNNLDRFTFNEEENKGFQCTPVNICLNDIGIQDKTFFGMDTGLLTDEFLHARNEIWTQYGKCAHLTTNLDDKALRKRFERNDSFGRLVDRFKTYNIIPMGGDSRR